MCIWCDSTILFWERITCHGFQSNQGGQSCVENWKGCYPKSQEALVLVPDLALTRAVILLRVNIQSTSWSSVSLPVTRFLTLWNKPEPFQTKDKIYRVKSDCFCEIKKGRGGGAGSMLGSSFLEHNWLSCNSPGCFLRRSLPVPSISCTLNSLALQRHGPRIWQSWAPTLALSLITNINLGNVPKLLLILISSCMQQNW